MKIDLNCDLGESFGQYTMGQDEEVIKYVTSVNIACGYHAGDHNVMSKTVQLAKKYGVGVGAHPGFQDLAGFGRREMSVSATDIYHSIIYQLGALQAFCSIYGVELRHVKPHGALYNMAAKNYELAEAIATAVKDFNAGLMLVGLANSELIRAGEMIGLKTVSEVFADRAYQKDGMLTPRTNKNAVIEDADRAAQQILQIVKHGKVQAVTGEVIPLKGDTICVHGDNEHALQLVKTIKERLLSEGIKVDKVGK